MILGFKTHIDGKPTHFVQKILAIKLDEYKKSFRPKIHTMRRGQRWKAGMNMHMAIGVRTKDYFQFNGGGIGLEKVVSTQFIDIDNYNNNRSIHVAKGDESGLPVALSEKEIETFALNDGFDSVEDFWAGFEKIYGNMFRGQIIHFTDFRY